MENFKEFIEKRIQYLENLKNLEDDWIGPGESEAPNENIIEYSQLFLREFNQFLINNPRLPIPNIVMGPLPVGGFSFTIKSPHDEFNVCFYNDEKNFFLQYEDFNVGFDKNYFNKECFNFYQLISDH